MEGLKLCWELGFKKVEVESDDATLITELHRNGRISGYYLISSMIEELIMRDWEIKFMYVEREGNQVADLLANLSSKLACKKYVWIQPPVEVTEVLDRDALGIGTFRHV
ncbi:uncharacterized protein LOC114741993 [Neltuma alba]|uniref:uncharacterized protein LOC114741993 n=1 Tax=Neltuma alba TaxID=207710 RepID=UPI0010A54E7B|nr:uncharacterized protein LOC114741993 [Prosopis alba]